MPRPSLFSLVQILLVCSLWLPRVSALGGRAAGEECIDCVVLDPETNSMIPDPDCAYNGPCICRTLTEVCYSDIPAAYDGLLSVLLILWLHKLYECTLYLLDIRASHRLEKKPFTPIEKIVIFTTFANIIRVIWVVCAFQGRNASVFWGGVALDGIFLKIPQILWCGSFFYLTVVWNTLSVQLLTMKKANAADSAKAERTANLINVFLFCVIIPLEFVGILAVPILALVVNAVQIVIVLILVGGSIFIGSKLVKGLSGNESGKSIVGTIKTTVACGIFAAVSLIVAVVWNALFQVGDPATTPMSIWGFWFGVHVTGEYLAVHGLLWTKHQQYYNKVRAAKVAATTTTSQTTHSAQSVVEH